MLSSKYQRPLIGAYLILINNKGEILLSKSNSGQLKGCYSLVAGHTETGENVFEAIIREAKEEANISLLKEHLKVVAVVHRPNANYKGGKQDIIDFFIKAKIYEGELKNNEPEKCSELAFYPLNKLPQNLLLHVKKVIEDKEKSFYFTV